MTRFHWLNGMRSMRQWLGLSPRGQHRKPTPSRGRLRPRLESLEDRTVPAIFTVNSLTDAVADDSFLSLREAITATNARAGADVIRFANGLTGTIALTQGRLNILDDLTILGPGAAHLAVSGGDATRIFHVAGEDVDANLSGLTITRGRSSQGAGLYNLGGSVSLTDVVFSDNVATGDGAEFGLGAIPLTEPQVR